MIYFNLLIFPGQHFQDNRQKRIYRSTEELHAPVNIDQYYFLYKDLEYGKITIRIYYQFNPLWTAITNYLIFFLVLLVTK